MKKPQVGYLKIKYYLKKVQVRNKKNTWPYLYQFNWSKTPKPAVSCTPRNATACFWVISPLAKGLSLVRA